MTDRAFRDTSSDCAICFESLDREDTIELSCGHRWHAECIKEQILKAQPNSSHRLLFSGCRCAKCGVFCDHEALQGITRRTDTLREKVEVLVKEQLKIDQPNQWQTSTKRNELIEAARRKYAFYLCRSCDEPYFGGTVDCADLDEGELPAEDQLCPSCKTQPQDVCRHPHDHRAFHIWKCRYCCLPSTFVCYGTVHFCTNCHTRNDKRVRQQRPGTINPPELEIVPCPGNACPFPKPKNQSFHKNGKTHTCEQVYRCLICETGNVVNPFLPSGTHNFVVNPSGEQGLRGWNFDEVPWEVETSEVPANENITTNFVSSYYWCRMQQKVPLHRYIHDVSSARVEVSAKHLARTDCPSTFRLDAIILDCNGKELNQITTNNLDSPADAWERASLIIEPTLGAHVVVIVIHGKDRKCWNENNGSKVAECSVRVLCSEEELPQILRPLP